MQKNRITHLKIKTKYLAAEARIIKLEERKALKRHRWKTKGKESTECYEYRELREHRHDVVRYESRHNLLAYGFLRGRSYAQMEQKCAEDNEPEFGKVEKLAKRFSPDRKEFDEKWEAWENEALSHLTGRPVSDFETPPEPKLVKGKVIPPKTEKPKGIVSSVISAITGK